MKMFDAAKLEWTLNTEKTYNIFAGASLVFLWYDYNVLLTIDLSVLISCVLNVAAGKVD